MELLKEIAEYSDLDYLQATARAKNECENPTIFNVYLGNISFFAFGERNVLENKMDTLWSEYDIDSREVGLYPW